MTKRLVWRKIGPMECLIEVEESEVQPGDRSSGLCGTKEEIIIKEKKKEKDK